MTVRIAVLIACLIAALPANADSLKRLIKSGTGFIVTKDGGIVTNAHVVEGCAGISVGGLAQMRQARLIAIDKTNDLALLKAPVVNAMPAPFRGGQPLAVGERVVVVGYPGKAALTGHAVTRETVVAVPGDRWLKLGDVVEEGNSGGPLLDAGGNVAGVVSAKMLTYIYRKSAPKNGVYRHYGAAISLPVLREFLGREHIRPQEARDGSAFSADTVGGLARRFVVNVRCELP